MVWFDATQTPGMSLPITVIRYPAWIMIPLSEDVSKGLMALLTGCRHARIHNGMAAAAM
jgi:hypothetical protein